MRTLEGDKKVSWFETPELEEQQHSSRVTRVLPPKRRNHPDQVFLNSQASDWRKPREVDFFPWLNGGLSGNIKQVWHHQ